MPKRHSIGPWLWRVWIKGIRKPKRMIAFDKDHIQDQLEGKKMLMAKRVPEPKEEVGKSMRLGPKGSKISRPADYDAGFKVLREWIDKNGGPPEEIRKKLRELWIDYPRIERKTTRYSAKKKSRY